MAAPAAAAAMLQQQVKAVPLWPAHQALARLAAAATSLQQQQQLSAMLLTVQVWPAVLVASAVLRLRSGWRAQMMAV
jgi:hypothetical protein